MSDSSDTHTWRTYALRSTMNAAQGTISISGLTATDQGLAAANQWLAAQNQQLMTMLAAPLHALDQWPKQHVQNSNRQNSRRSNSTWIPTVRN